MNASDLPKEVANFQEEQIGFPPYWNPSEGKKFYARVVDVDDADPDFQRFVLQAGHDIECQRGPSADAETVVVHKGEFFTCSVYASLPLHRYLDIPVLVTVKGKRKLDGARTLWEFSLAVSEQAKKVLAKRRQENMMLKHNTKNEIKAVPVSANGHQSTEAEDQIPF
jgi:hypothetical protein